MLIKNLLTGTLYRVLGTSLSDTTPPKSYVWLQKVDQPRFVLPWPVTSMMNGWHSYVAVDEHGEQQRRD